MAPPIRFDTEPGRYRHLRLEIDGEIARIVIKADEQGGIARNARALAGLGLSEDVLAGVLAGNAMKVYPGVANILQSLDATSY